MQKHRLEQIQTVRLHLRLLPSLLQELVRALLFLHPRRRHILARISLLSIQSHGKYIPSADFSIDTFGGNYENGGIIPAEGAEVDVVTTTISGPVDDIVNTEVMGAMNIVTSTMVVDKVTCEKATGRKQLCSWIYLE